MSICFKGIQSQIPLSVWAQNRQEQTFLVFFVVVVFSLLLVVVLLLVFFFWRGERGQGGNFYCVFKVQMIKESSGLDDFSVQKDIVSICLVSVLPLPNACTLVSATLRECIYTCTCSSGDTACVLVHSESRLFLC